MNKIATIKKLNDDLFTAHLKLGAVELEHPGLVNKCYDKFKLKIVDLIKHPDSKSYGKNGRALWHTPLYNILEVLASAWRKVPFNHVGPRMVDGVLEKLQRHGFFKKPEPTKVEPHD